MHSGQTAQENHSPPEKRPRPITPHEVEELRWYFEKGIGRIERPSYSVDQMERVAFYHNIARPCRKCGGKWLRKAADGTILQEEEGGSGFVTSTKEWKEKVKLAKLLDHPVDWPGDITCKNCDGKGWVEGGPRRRRKPSERMYQWIDGPVTARPTGSSMKGNGVPETGGTESLRRLGRLDRLLAQLRRRDPVAYVVLEIFYCPAGLDLKLTSLWHLTPAGKTMLRGNNLDLSPRQYFDNLSQRQQQKPDANRQLQFEAADRQSKQLLLHAQNAWTTLLDEEDWKEAT